MIGPVSVTLMIRDIESVAQLWRQASPCTQVSAFWLGRHGAVAPAIRYPLEPAASTRPVP